MSGNTKKSFAYPDETRRFELGQVDLVNIGGVSFGRGTLRPGWKWSTCVKPLVKTDSCQASHLQYQLSGRLHVRMDDGTEFESGPGDIAQVAPGHDAWVVGSETVVLIDITGMVDYAKPK